MKRAFIPSGLYPILDAQWLDAATIRHNTSFSPDAIAQHLATLPITQIQLRCKTNERQTEDFFTTWMQALRYHCPDLPIIINDHVELAASLQADGVHVGQDDLPIPQCRQLLGQERIIGLSTHSLAEVRHAESMAVDYVGFGPIFATQTKNDTQPVQGLTGLTSMVQATRLPVVAIGGLTMDRMRATAESGASAVAMISDLWSRDWPERLTQACNIWQEFIRHGTPAH